MALGKFDGVQDTNIGKAISLAAANISKVDGHDLSTSFADGGNKTVVGDYTIHTFTADPRISTIKLYVKGAGNYSNDGEFFIFDNSSNWMRWAFSYTTSWAEITLNVSSPTGTSGVLSWGYMNYYRFDVNTTGRTVYVDNIRMYDASGALVHSNLCEATTSWTCANGTLSLDSSAPQQGTYCLKVISSAGDCATQYNPTGTWDWLNPQTFVVQGAKSMDYLIIGGGGGGGFSNVGGGGGGAGGMVTGTFSATAQTYNIRVGSGGSYANALASGGMGLGSRISAASSGILLSYIKLYVDGTYNTRDTAPKFTIWDLFGNWVSWDFTYSAGWAEKTFYTNNISTTSANPIDWTVIRRYGFEMHQSTYICFDNIRLYDASNNILASDMCENTSWGAAYGSSFATRTTPTPIPQGTYC